MPNREPSIPALVGQVVDTPSTGTAQTGAKTETSHLDVERLRKLLQAVDLLLAGGFVDQARAVLAPLLVERGAAIRAS